MIEEHKILPLKRLEDEAMRRYSSKLIRQTYKNVNNKEFRFDDERKEDENHSSR